MRKIFSEKVTKNTGWLFISQFITKLLSLLLIVYLGKNLSTEDFGKFTLANAIVSIFVILVDYGFNIYIVREIAKAKEKAGVLLASILPFKLIMAFVTICGLYLTIKIMQYSYITSFVIICMGVYYVLLSFSMFFRTVFMANEMMEYESIFSIVDKFLIFISVLLLLYNKIGIISIVLIHPIIEIFMLTTSMYLVIKKFPQIKYTFSKELLKISIKESTPFFLSSILLMVYLYIDTVMLSKMQSEIAVGLYNASYNLVYNLRMLVSPLIISLFPSMSLNASLDKSNLNFVYKKCKKLLLISGILITIICFLLSKQIILLLYGKKYIESIPAFSILIWEVPFIYLNGFYSYLLTSLNYQKSILYYLIIASLVNIILNIIFIPRFSFLGASVTTVLSEILYFILISRKLNKLGFI